MEQEFLNQLIDLLEKRIYDPENNTAEEITRNILFVNRTIYSDDDYMKIKECITYLMDHKMLSYTDKNKEIETDEGFAQFYHRIYKVKRMP